MSTTDTKVHPPEPCEHCDKPGVGPRLEHPYESVDWAFMKWADIESGHYPGHTYLRRLRIFQTPRRALYHHRIYEPDTQAGQVDPFPHNHPANFYMFILWGGYEERYWPADTVRFLRMEPDRTQRVRKLKLFNGRVQRWVPGSFHRMGTGDMHFIIKLLRVPSHTLLWVGRRNPEGWGFLTDEGYVDWRKFTRTSG